MIAPMVTRTMKLQGAKLRMYGENACVSHLIPRSIYVFAMKLFCGIPYRKCSILQSIYLIFKFVLHIYNALNIFIGFNSNVQPHSHLILDSKEAKHVLICFISLKTQLISRFNFKNSPFMYIDRKFIARFK